MKIVRFEFNGRKHTGILEDNVITEKTGKKYIPENVKFLPPINPKKIICIGFNYRKHMKELKDIATKNPTLTLKSQNSVIGHNDYIVIPNGMKYVEYEAELGIVIGKSGYRIECGREAKPLGHMSEPESEPKALIGPKNFQRKFFGRQSRSATNPKEHILGYTIVNDVTSRELEREMVQWSASKSFPTFCPIGPWIETELETDNLGIKCWVNGDLRQDGNTRDMIYNAEKCIKFVSRFMILEEGDLIATGTPGTGKLFDGDVIEIEIEGIGKLRNYVKNGKELPYM